MNVIRLPLIALCLASSVAWASHPLPPLYLKQRSPGGAAVAPGGTIYDTAIELTATSDALTWNTATPDYQLHFEVRPSSASFTGTATHQSTLIAKPTGIEVEYPYTTVPGLGNGSFKWQVREVRGTTLGTWVLFNGGNTAFSVLQVQVTPSALAFGGQKVGTQSTPLQATLVNQSQSPVEISAAGVTGPFTLTSGPSLPLIIPTGGSAVFDITATPPAIGNHSGTFSITSNAPNSPHTAALTVTGADPQLTLVPSTTSFGEWGINGAAATRSISLQNTGNAPLTVTGATTSAPFGVTGLSPSVVPAGGSTTFQVTFQPTVTGPASGTVTVNSDSPGGPHTVSVSGTGTEPVLVLAPAAITFPDVLVGQQSAPVSFSIGNSGVGTLNLLAPVVSGPFNTTLVAGTVPQGVSQSYTARFAPTTPGPFSGSVVIGSDSTGQPHSLTLDGVARAAVAQLAPAALNAGPVALGAYQTAGLTLTNTGDAPLTVTAMTVTSPAPGEFSLSGAPPLPFTLAPGQSQQFAVRFTPSTVGARTGTLTLGSNRYPAGPLTVPLSGQGDGAVITTSATSLNFNEVNVGGTGLRTLTVTNSGNAPLTVNGLVFSTGAASDFGTAHAVPFTLPPGGNAAVTVQFQPTASGNRASKLTVVSTDPLKPGAEVTLAGIGQSPALAVSPLSLGYEQVRVGQNKQLALTIQNTGSGPLTIGSLTFLGNDASRFTLTGVGAPFTLGAGAPAAMVTVTYSPTSVGSSSAVLHIASDDPQAPAVQVTLTGEGVAPGLALSTTNLSFGAQVVARPSAPRTFEIANTGNAALQIFSLAVTGTGSSSFQVTAPTGSFGIPVGESRVVSMVMTAGTVGESVARLNVQSDRPGGLPAHVDLLGLGVSEVFQVSPTSLDFGIVKTGTSSNQLTVTLSNVSSEALPMSPATITGPGAGDFGVIFTAAQVDGLGNVSARVTYKPQTAGQHLAELRLTSSDNRVPPVTVGLVGNSLSQVLEASPASHDFGPVPVDVRQSHAFTLVNKTNQPLVIGAISSSNPAFEIEPGAPGAIEPGKPATLTVSFAPRSEGPAFATLNLSLEGQPESQVELTLAVSGVGSKPVKAGGCAAAGGPSLAWLLLGLAVPALRRRRKAAGPAARATPRSAAALKALALLLCVAGAWPSTAQAQTYVVTQAPQAYVPLSGATPITLSPTDIYSSVDEGFTTLPLGFTFPYYGSTFTAIGVSSNGMLTFAPHTPCNGTGILCDTFTTPSTTTPNGFIAGWVADLDGNPGGALRYLKPNPSEIVIEYSQWGYYDASAARFSFQVRLTASGLIQVHYGTHGSGTHTGRAGFESPSGTQGAYMLPCNASCPATANWPTNTLFTIGPPVSLTPASLNFGGQAVGVQSQAMTVAFDNGTGGPVTISATNVTGPFSVVSGPALPVTVPASSQVSFGIVASPPSIGSHSGSFAVTSTAAGSPHSAALAVLGAQAQVNLTPGSVSFGDWGINGAAATRTVTLQNTGNAPLTVSGGSAAAPFGVSGLSGLVVPAGQSAQFTVSFLPTATGPHSGTVTINSNAPGAPHQLPVDGTGTAPTLVLTQASLTFPDVVVGQQSAPLSFSIGNTGVGTLNVLTPTVSGPFTTTLVSGQVAQGGSNAYAVTFAPTAPGNISGTLVIPSDSAGPPATLALSGVALAPMAELTPSPVSFGAVALGGFQSLTVTLANPGDAPLTVTGLSIAGGAAGEFSLSGLPGFPFTVPAAGAQPFDVRFEPSTVGPRSATVTLTSNRYPAGPLLAQVSGVGDGAVMVLSASTLDFDQVNLAATGHRTLTVANSGNQPLTVSGLVISTGAAADFASPMQVPFTVAPGAAATVPVTFTPAMAGARASMLTLATDAPLQPSAQVTLTGVGRSPSLAASPLSVAFGQVRVGQLQVRTVNLQNTGNGPLTITDLTFTGPDAGRFTRPAGLLPLTLQPGTPGAIVQLTFMPTAVGMATAALNVLSDDPQNPALQIQLGGEGVAPALSISAPALSFGSQVVGRTSSPRSFQVVNDGSAPLQVFSLALTGAASVAFQVTQPAGPFSVPAGGSQTVSVVMTPATAGELSARLNVQSDAPGAPTAQVDVLGLGISEVFQVSPASLDFGARKVGTASPQATLTLTNLSSESLPLSPALLTGAGSASFQVAFTATTVEPEGSVTARVTYRPQAGGLHQAELRLASADTRVPAVLVPLKGTGISQVLEAAPPTHDFAGVELEKTDTATFSISNRSGHAVTLGAITSSHPAFTVADGAPTTLEAGQAASLSVVFQPTEVGAATGVISLSLEGQPQPELTLAVAGTGTPRTDIDAGGCAAAGGPSLAWLLLGLAVPALRRRRAGRG